jgi:hypothetical protein
MSEIVIKSRREDGLVRFLNMNDFNVEELENEIFRVTRSDEIPVYLKVTETTLFFEVDLGSIKEIGTEELYFKLLEMNNEILPVSFGVNNTNTDDPRLILVESRECSDLDDHELLSVFDALELAVDRAEQLLQQWMKD